MLGGLGWVVGSQVGLQLTRALAAIAIARLLTPEEYGLAALALVFASLVLVFSDLALGAALIQRKELSERRPRHRLLGHARAAASSSRSSAFALAGPLAALYGDADAKPLLAGALARRSWSARSARPSSR